MIQNSFSGERHLGQVPAGIVKSLRLIDLAQGRLDRLTGDAPALADALAARSQIESVIASNELEGIRTARDRVERLVRAELEPRSRDEFEIAGYRSALDDVYARPHEAVTVPRLLHWHRELFRYAGPDVAGRFKRSENRVLNPDGSDRFATVPAAVTVDAVSALADAAEQRLASDSDHPVLVTAAFTLDLLVIHPFEDGNGRTARIASNAMLVRSGYVVGRFISVEQVLNERRTAYYEGLRRSTDGWHSGDHSIWPWAEFFVNVVGDAYRALETRLLTTSDSDHRGLVVEWLRTTAPASFTMREARAALAGVPDGAIRHVLAAARATGALGLRGVGRGSTWVVLDRRSLG